MEDSILRVDQMITQIISSGEGKMERKAAVFRLSKNSSTIHALESTRAKRSAATSHESSAFLAQDPGELTQQVFTP